ncbi:hypothetical protein ACWXVM_00675 [Mycoplasma sp. 2261]
MNRRTKKRTTAVVMATIATASTLAAVFLTKHHNDFVASETNNRLLKQFEKSNSLFEKVVKKLSPSPKQMKELDKLIDAVKLTLSNPNSTAVEKFIALDDIKNVQKDYIIKYVKRLISNNEINKYSMKEIEELLKDQASRIREIDIKNQFDSIDLTDLKIGLSSFAKLNKEQQFNWINRYSETLTIKIELQRSLIEKYLLIPSNSFDENIVELKKMLPTKALRGDIEQVINQIENDLLFNDFRINDIAINKQLVENKIMDTRSTTKHGEFNDFYQKTIKDIEKSIDANILFITSEILKKSINRQTDKDLSEQLELLSNKILLTNSVLQNKNVFDQMITFVIKNKMILQEELNEILNYQVTKNYINLVEYYNNIVAIKIDSSLTIADLRLAKANFDIYEKALNDQQLSSEQIINEFKLFVEYVKNVNINNLGNHFGAILNEKDYKVLVNTNNFEKNNKQEIINKVIDFMNRINHIQYLDSYITNIINEYSQVHKNNPRLLNEQELNIVLNQLAEVDNANINDVQDKISNINDSVSTLVETRLELANIAKEIDDTIININGFNSKNKEKYLSKDVLQKATDLKNQILSENIIANLTTQQIIEKKYSIREQLRTLQKAQLDYLQKATSLEIARLKDYDLLSITQLTSDKLNQVKSQKVDITLLAKIFDKLNIESKKITSINYNPIISKDILNQIQKYKLIAILETTYLQNNAAQSRMDVEDYTLLTFNPTNEHPHIYTDYEQTQLDKLSKTKQDLTDRATEINNLLKELSNGNSVDTQKINSFSNTKWVEDVIEITSNIQESAKIIRKVNSTLNDLDKLIDEINGDDDIKHQFVQDFAEIEQIKADIKKALSATPVDFALVNRLSQEADKKLVNLRDKRKDSSLESQIKSIEKLINKNYPHQDASEPVSEGESSLRYAYNELLNQSRQQGLTKSEKDEILDKANKIKAMIPYVKGIENNIARYEKISDEYNAHIDKRSRVPQTIASAEGTKNEIDLVIRQIANINNLPDVAKVADSARLSKSINDDLDLAFHKDQIRARNEAIQAKTYPISANLKPIETKINDAIKQLDAYAKSKETTTSDVTALDAVKVLTGQSELVDITKRAILEADKIKNSPSLVETESAKDANALLDEIEKNLPDHSDTIELIGKKKKAIEDAIVIAQSKHELRKIVINDLVNVLSEDQQKYRILEVVKNKVNAAKEIYEKILSVNSSSGGEAYTPESLALKVEELNELVKKLAIERDDLINKYKEEKARIELEVIQYDKKSYHNLAKPDALTTFDNYEKARQKYVMDINDPINSTIESIRENERMMAAGYHKDIVLITLEKYKNFVKTNVDALHSSSEKNFIKTYSDRFLARINNQISIDIDFPIAQNLIVNINEMLKFHVLQIDVATELDLYQKDLDSDVKTRAIAELKALLSGEHAPLETLKIKQQNEYVLKELTRIKEEAGLRARNKQKAIGLLQHFENFRALPGLNNGQNQNRVLVNEIAKQIFGTKIIELGDLADNSLATNSKEAIDQILSSNLQSTTKAQLLQVKNRIETIEKIKEYYDILALIIGSAETIISAAGSAINDTVNSYITQDLNPLLSQARDLFKTVSTDNTKTSDELAEINKQKFVDLIKKIQVSKERILDVIEVTEKIIGKIKDINSDLTFYDLESISGTRNNDKIDSWLNSLLAEAANNLSETTDLQKSQRIQKVKSKSEETLKLVQLLKQVSQTVGIWRLERQGSSNYDATQFDENKLIQFMWNALPNIGQNPEKEQITKYINELTTKVNEQTKIRQTRKDLFDAINNIKGSAVYQNAKQYLPLITSLNNQIDDIIDASTNKEETNSVEKLNENLNKVNNLKAFLSKLVELASKATEIEQFVSAFVPLDVTVNTNKAELENELATVKTLYEANISSADQTEEASNKIDKKIKKLELLKARLEVYQQLASVKLKIKNDTVIIANEKAVINKKITEFENELKQVQLDENTDPNTFANLAQKWLNGTGNDSIEYVFANAKTLAYKYQDAQNILSYKQTGLNELLDSDAVKEAYNQLQTLITESKQLNSNTNNDELAKLAQIKKIQDKIDGIVNEKVNSARSLRTKTSELHTKLSKQGQNEVQSGVLLSTFEANAVNSLNINNVKTKDNTYSEAVEAINKTNTALRKALDEYKKQIVATFDTQQTLLNTEFQKFVDFNANIINDTLWTQGAKDKLINLRKLKTSIETFINQNKNFKNTVDSKYISIGSKNSFINDFINLNLENIKLAKEAKQNLTQKIKDDISQMIEDGTGIISKLTTTFDKYNSQFSNNVSTKLFEKAGFENSKKLFDELKPKFELLKQKISTIKTTESAPDLQTYAFDTKQLINGYDELINEFKLEFSSLLNKRRDLTEIYQLLFKTSVKWKNNNNKLTALETKYSQDYESLNSEKDNLVKEKSGDIINDLFLVEKTNNALNNIESKLKVLLDWTNTNSKLFYETILGETNSNDQNANKTKPYYQISAKPGITREEFDKKLEIILPNNSSNELDITNLDGFLELFDTFAFTKIDSNSIYNPLNFKVKLVKDSSTSKFIKPGSSSITEKTNNLKLRYEFKPTNLEVFKEFSGFSVEKDVDITFKTKQDLQLQARTSGLFFKDYNKSNLGKNTKQVIGKADELGWMQTIAEEVKKQTIKTFKEALGLENSNDAVIINYKTKEIFDYKNANNAVSATVTKRDGWIDKANFNIKFQFPEFDVYQQSTSVTWESENQILRIRVINDKLIQVEAILPGKILVGPQNYTQNQHTIVDTQGNKITNASRQTYDPSKTMPVAAIYTLRLDVDYDQDSKDVSLFINRYESFNVAKNKALQDSSITPLSTFTTNFNNNKMESTMAYVWSNYDFAKWLSTHPTSWQTPDNADSSNKSPLDYPNNGFRHSVGSNKEWDHMLGNDLWVKNTRSSGTYIWTNNDQQQIIQDSEIEKLAVVYNSGIINFEFKDLKK